MYLAGETSPAIPVGLGELDRVYSFVFSRVGNRADAEDLTQQVALKALPRLRFGASDGEIRAYLHATARSVLAAFWAGRYRLPESELADDLADRNSGQPALPSPDAAEWLEQTLSALPAHYRQVLELRFLQGCSVREAAREMNRTEGAVKVMQLRALRAAAGSVSSTSPARPERRPRAAAPGFAFEPQPEAPGA